jgi:hypothetical protein
MRSSGRVARTWSIASAGVGAFTSPATASALVSPLGRCLTNQLMTGRYPRSRWPLVQIGVQPTCQGRQLDLVLDHPRDGAVQAALPTQPRAAAGIIPAMGVAVVDDAAQLVAREDVTEGRGTVSADLPDTERAGDRRHRERVCRDRPAQNLCRDLT